MKPENKKTIHWPSFMWLIAGISTVGFSISQQNIYLGFQGGGFLCMSYSSIRLVPANLFTQDLTVKLKPTVNHRKIDGIIQCLGFFLLLSGIVGSKIYT